ncbi:hypothetical protein C8J56DRAFT_251003 [Mycena floridula]|nr:hypothetical protein C8J56DRAFT_251003 [Mycena floridula]
MMTILRIASAAAMMLVHVSAQASGFSASCSEISLSGFTLLADCKNQSAVSVAASIDLNTCITNDNSVLRCQANGLFGASCSSPGFLTVGDFHDIGTFCPPSSFVQFSLDQCIQNLNGVLSCIT